MVVDGILAGKSCAIRLIIAQRTDVRKRSFRLTRTHFLLPFHRPPPAVDGISLRGQRRYRIRTLGGAMVARPTRLPRYPCNIPVGTREIADSLDQDL